MKTIDVDALARRLAEVPSIEFALLFGSAQSGVLPMADSDVDVAVFLDHAPDLGERSRLIGLVQDTVATDRVDLVFLNLTDNAILQRESLKGRLLVCRDRDAYAAFFSVADRRGRDEEERIRRAWVMRRELRGEPGAGG